MLSFLQYRTLTSEARARYVFGYGTFLACRVTHKHSVSLYYLGPFFCEAWVSLRQGELVRLICFTGQRGLLSYADLVQLPPLFAR